MFKIPFSVEESISIDSSAENVYKSVSNFSTWGEWSPWICQEPSCPVRVEGDSGTVGHRQIWDGDLIGAGEMSISKAVPNEILEYDLQFLKPWKSRSKTGFQISSQGEKTLISWWMTGTLPVFLFYMKKMMSVFVGGDYNRGLLMLKEYIETGKVLSKTAIKGVVKQEEFYYIGKRKSCRISDIGPEMAKDFAELNELVENSTLPQPKGAISIYHSFEMLKGTCEYTSGFTYDSRQTASNGVVDGQISARKSLRVDHLGPYRHLGNAWTTAMGYVRAKHKADKSQPMYEIYANNPNEVPEEEVLTEIHVPIKR